MTRHSRLARNMEPSATVGIADIAIEMRARGVDVVDLSAGRAAEHTPDYVCDAAVSAIRAGDTHQTHGQGTVAFRQACADMLKNTQGMEADPETEIIATQGIKQGLTLAFLTLLDPGDEVLIEDPSFVSYEPIINMAGAKAVRVPLLRENGFRWTAAQLEAALSSKTRAILISSPQNPTGTVHTVEDLEVIAAIAMKYDLLVVADEIYERVTWGGREHTSIARLPGMRQRSWTVMGLTKTFSMGGWRIGFVHAPAPDVAAMLEVQRHLVTCCNSFVQAGAAAAFGQPPLPEVRALWKDWEKRCAYLSSALDGMPGLSCQMPEGGFYAWADVAAMGRPSAELAGILLREFRVASVPGSAFGPHGEGYIRFTCVRSWEELREGVDRIGRFVESLGGQNL